MVTDVIEITLLDRFTAGVSAFHFPTLGSVLPFKTSTFMLLLTHTIFQYTTYPLLYVINGCSYAHT